MSLLLASSLFALAFVPVPHPVERQLQEGLSGCQTCCSPGGSCAAAWHGEPGMCCGTAGQAYCCPPYTTAVCVKCNIGYKCAKAGAARSLIDLNRICADMGGAPAFAILGLIAFGIYRCCVAANQQQPHMVQMGAPPPYGASAPPYGAPGYGYGQQPAYGYGAQPAAAGYGGGTVAAAGGVGFLGGMLVGEAISDAGDHGRYGGGGGGYGGGSGGSGYAEGGDGGDGGFAADS